MKQIYFLCEHQMTNRDESFSKLQMSLENDPQSHPYGYYFHDLNPGGAGGFHWHEDEEPLLNEIANNLCAWITQDDELGDEIQEGLSDIIKSAAANNADIDWSKLQSALSSYLLDKDVTIAWTGTFYSLCLADDEWANKFREEFHEVSTPIGEDEMEDFIEFISQYGQS